MAIGMELQIKVGQKLKLTPQLQQSINILQSSALEIKQTIETTLQNNFILEEITDEDDDNDNNTIDSELDKTNDPNNSLEVNSLNSDMEIDCDWNEVYTDYTTPHTSVNNEEYTAAENYTSSNETLHSKLYWQSDIYPWQNIQKIIADFIIDNIDDDGFLKSSLDDIKLDILKQHIKLSSSDLSIEQLEKVLSIIQSFEPAGVASRSLQETLLIQLNEKRPTPYVLSAKQLIQENIDWLNTRDYKRIKKTYGLSEEDLTILMKLIQTLNPRPGSEFSQINQEFIEPDLILNKDLKTSKWKVELNNKTFPNLKVNSEYVTMVKELNNKKEDIKIKEQVLEATSLIKSIRNRGETLLRVGKYLVETQADFFSDGEQYMQPLVLKDAAEALDLHESTISRTTRRKYIQTPRGTFELKFFFSNSITQYTYGELSATAIRSIIKEMINNEDHKNPLSDNQIMLTLEDKNILIARRTISKHRSTLKIDSANNRKKMYEFNNI